MSVYDDALKYKQRSSAQSQRMKKNKSSTGNIYEDAQNYISEYGHAEIYNRITPKKTQPASQPSAQSYAERMASRSTTPTADMLTAREFDRRTSVNNGVYEKDGVKYTTYADYVRDQNDPSAEVLINRYKASKKNTASQVGDVFKAIFDKDTTVKDEWADVRESHDNTESLKQQIADTGYSMREARQIAEQEQEASKLKATKYQYDAMSEEDRKLLDDISTAEADTEGTMFSNLLNRNSTPQGPNDILTQQQIKRDELMSRLINKGYTTDEITALTRYRQSINNAAITKSRQEAIDKAYDEHPVIAQTAGSAASAVTNIAKPLGIFEYVKAKLTDTPVDPNSAFMIGANTTDELREGVTSRHNWVIGSDENGEGGYDVFDMLYGTAMSSVDSVIASALMPGLGLEASAGSGFLKRTAVKAANGILGGGLIGAEAATDTMRDLTERGASTSQAFTGGLVAGAFEGLFESFSIGEFNALKESGKAGVKNLLVDLAKSAGVNASEEGLTEIANIVYDTVANGNISQYQQAIDEYVNSGMSEEDARKQVIKDLAYQVLESAAGGALQGVMMGGFGGAVRSSSDIFRGRNINNRGEAAELIDTVKSNYADNTNSPAYKTAEKYAEMLEKGEKLNSKQVGYLQRVARDEAYNEAFSTEKYEKKTVISDISSALEKKGEVTGNTKAVANAVYKELTGKSLNKNEINLIKGSSAAQDYLAEKGFDKSLKSMQSLIKAQNISAFGTAANDKSRGATKKERMAYTNPAVVVNGKQLLVDGGNVKKGEFLKYNAVFKDSDGDNAIRLADGSQSKIKDLKFADTNSAGAHLLSNAAGMSAELANIYIDQYDGEAMEDYDKAFNQLKTLGSLGTTAQAIARTSEYNPASFFDTKSAKKILAEGLKSREFKAGLTNFATNRELINKVGDGVLSIVDKIGKDKGFEFILFDSLGKSGSEYNGAQLDGNRIMLSLDADNGLLLRTVAHEQAHFLKKFNKSGYIKLLGKIKNAIAKKDGKTAELIDKYITQGYATGESEENDAALEELVCDSLYRVYNNEGFIRDLANSDKKLAEQLGDNLDSVITSIEAGIQGLKDSGKHKEIEILEDDLETLKDIQDTFHEELKTASAEYQRQKAAGKADGDGINLSKKYYNRPSPTVDNYTEQQYNDYGWIAANNVMSYVEYGSLTHQFDDLINLGYKYSVSGNKEALIIAYDENHNATKLAGIKGTTKHPIITKVISVVNVSNDLTRMYLEAYKDGEDRQSYEDLAGEQIFDIKSQQDYPSYSELKRQRQSSEKSGRNSESLLYRNGSSSEDTESEYLNNEPSSNDGGFSMPKFSGKDNIEETKDLVAVHNTTEEKLLAALEMGGLPMPSIAIVKKAMGHSEFGDISLVFGKETIDPKIAKNKVYSRDAYTPTSIRIDYKVNPQSLHSVEKTIKETIESGGFKSNVLGYLGLDAENVERDFADNQGNVAQALNNRPALKLAYAIENGINLNPKTKDITLDRFGRYDNSAIINAAGKLDSDNISRLRSGKITNDDITSLRNILNEDADSRFGIENLYDESNFGRSDVNAIVDGVYLYNSRKGDIGGEIDQYDLRKQLDEKVDDGKFKNWLNEKFKPIIEKKGIRNNADTFTNSGNRRSWDALHWEYTLENVVKKMKADSTQKGKAMFGVNITGASSRNFKSIAEIKSASGSLRMESMEEFQQAQREFLDRFSLLAERFAGNNNWRTTDGCKEVMVEAINKYNSLDPESIKSYLKKESQGWANYDDSIAEDLIQLVKDIREMPTGYFEAKPQRAVGLGEIRSVIVPDNASEQLKSALKKIGLTVNEYKSGDEQDRLDKLNETPEAAFSTKDTEYMAAAKRGDMETAQRMVDEAAKAAGYEKLVYHGTLNKSFTVFDINKAADGSLGKGFYFSGSKEYAKGYTVSNGTFSGRVIEAYINIKNPYIAKYPGGIDTEKLKAQGYDGVYSPSNDFYILFDPSQIKSAEPITYDNSGNIIPLSERFNEENEDIRWSTKDMPLALEIEKSINSAGLSLKSKDNNKNNLRIKAFLSENYPDLDVSFFNDKETGHVVVNKIQSKAEVEARRIAFDEKATEANRQRIKSEAYYSKLKSMSGREKLFDYIDQKVYEKHPEAYVHRSNSSVGSMSFYVEWNNAEDEDYTIKISDHFTISQQMEHPNDFYIDVRDCTSNSDVLRKVNSIIESTKTKFSTKDTANEVDRYYDDVIRENRALQMIFSNLDGSINTMRKDYSLDQKEVDRLARDILRQNKSKDENFGKALTTIFDYLLQMEKGKNVDTDAAAKYLMQACMTMLEKSEAVDDELYNESKDLRDRLRKNGVYVSPELKEHLAAEYGSAKELQQAFFGKVRLVTDKGKGATPLNELWDEFHEQFPQFIKEDVENEIDQFNAILGVLDLTKKRVYQPFGKSERTYGSMRTESYLQGVNRPYLEQRAAEIAGWLLGEYGKLTRTYTDKQRMLNYKYDIDRQYNEYRKQLAEEQKEFKAKTTKELASWQALKIEQYKFKREMSDNRRVLNNNIDRVWNYLNTRANERSKSRHIPDGYENLVKAALRAIPGGVGDGRQAVLDKDKLNTLITNYKSKAAEIYNGENSDITELITSVEELIANQFGDGAPVPRRRDLSLTQLRTLNNLMANIKHLVDRENKLFGEGRQATIDSIKDDIVADYGGMPNSKIQRGVKDKKIQVYSVADDFRSGLTKPEYLFKNSGSNTLYELYKDVRRGENAEGRILYNAKEFLNNAKRQYNYEGVWGTRTITLNSVAGDKVTMTMQDAMYIYALSRREQGRQHLIGDFARNIVGGGIRVTDAKTKNTVDLRLTLADLAAIEAQLTEDQKGYVRAVTEYLSKDIGAERNKTSMDILGFEKYGEENYITINVVKGSLKQNANRAETNGTIANQGASKTLNRQAKNAVQVSAFDDVVSEHIYQSALYCGYAVSTENFNRVWNSKVNDTKLIHSLIEDKLGSNLSNYMHKFMVDVNSGQLSVDQMAIPNKLMTKAKKAATMANISVIVQQPTAVFRAMLYIEPQYILTTVASKSDLEEMYKYNGCALKKDIGYFDVNTGKSATDWLNEYDDEKKLKSVLGKENWSRGEKWKQYDLFGSKVEDWAGWGANKADEITWGAIWNACKKKVAAEQNLSGEELLNEASKLFQDTIALTQVYDSVFTKCDYMRRKEGLSQMATAFMSEPITSLNMLSDAIHERAKGVEGSGKKVIRAFACFAASTVTNAALKALVQILRDDDKERDFLVKYLTHITSNVFDDVFGLVPYISDIISMMQGYDPSRLDTQFLSTTVQTFQYISKQIKSDTPDWEKVVSMSFNMVAQLTGKPAYNVYRDSKAIVDKSKPLVKRIFNTILNKEPLWNKETQLEFSRSDLAQSLREEFDFLPGVSEKPDYSGLVDDYIRGKRDKIAKTAKRLDEDDLKQVTKAIGKKYKAGKITRDQAGNALAVLSKKSPKEAEKYLKSQDTRNADDDE